MAPNLAPNLPPISNCQTTGGWPHICRPIFAESVGWDRLAWQRRLAYSFRSLGALLSVYDGSPDFSQAQSVNPQLDVVAIDALSLNPQDSRNIPKMFITATFTEVNHLLDDDVLGSSKPHAVFLQHMKFAAAGRPRSVEI